MKPTYEELRDFAIWAQTRQKLALRIMEWNELKIADLNDPMQKLAFTFYTDLCEIASKVDALFEEDK